MPETDNGAHFSDILIVLSLNKLGVQAVFLRLVTNIIFGVAERLEGANKP